MDGVAPSKRNEFAIGAVIAELEKFSYIEVWVLDPKNPRGTRQAAGLRQSEARRGWIQNAVRLSVKATPRSTLPAGSSV
jgi:hypothetical protein